MVYWSGHFFGSFHIFSFKLFFQLLFHFFCTEDGPFFWFISHFFGSFHIFSFKLFFQLPFHFFSVQKMGPFFCFISYVFFQTIIPVLISLILYKRYEFIITIHSHYLHGISVSPLYNQGYIKKRQTYPNASIGNFGMPNLCRVLFAMFCIWSVKIFCQ